MSNERPLFSKEKLQNKKFEIKKAKSIEEIRDYFDFSDPLIGVDWGENGPPVDYTPEYIFNNPELTQLFLIHNKHKEIIAGAKVVKMTIIEKRRLGLTGSEFTSKEGVLLEYTAVGEQYRNNGLLKELTDRRIQWAFDHGADYVCSEAEITNPVSVYTKIRDGFVLIGICASAEGIARPYFVEYKNLKPENPYSNTIETSVTKLREVIVTEDSFADLSDLFADGWIGIDIKGNQSEPEMLETPWTLIMRRDSTS